MQMALELIIIYGDTISIKYHRQSTLENTGLPNF